VSEVARLRLDAFDWRNETFCVHRAKRGGMQQRSRFAISESGSVLRCR
jgi:hypothetical protein